MLHAKHTGCSTWRPRNEVCEDNPLAVCDYRTVNAETDLIACDRVVPERAGEVYYIHQNDNQQWASSHSLGFGSGHA